LAEKLPAFRGGFVKTLQSIRDYQRKRSDELYAETRAPAGVDISYSGFRLMELFPAEEYDRLISGLRKLFPAQRYGRDEIDRLGTNVPNLFSGGWSSIGLLRREKSWLGTLQTRTIPDLPEEVSTIEVGTHKILPSAVVVAFDVRLTASATSGSKHCMIGNTCLTSDFIDGHPGVSTVGPFGIATGMGDAGRHPRLGRRAA